jgi:hypothetical protein
MKQSTFEAKELQKLRNIEDKILCKACRCLKSTSELIQTLQELNDNLPRTNPTFSAASELVRQQLELIVHRLEGHINAAEILAERVQATLGLVSQYMKILETLI